MVSGPYRRNVPYPDRDRASSASGFVALQLAKVAGLRTICIVDVARHGERLSRAGADVLVDRLDTERAIAVVRGVTNGKLRYALDTIGKDTAEHLMQMLGGLGVNGERSHLVGLAAVPKSGRPGVVLHQVPIKVFHDIHSFGENLMAWLERLLVAEKLVGPEIEVAPGGLGGVNRALDGLRQGAVSGKRYVVPLHDGAEPVGNSVVLPHVPTQISLETKVA